MRLCDYLAMMLQAQAKTLTLLAQFMGEDKLIQALEKAETRHENLQKSTDVPLGAFSSTGDASSYSTFKDIEKTVAEFRLSSSLEFYLWSYPLYRVWVEQNIDWNGELLESPDALITQASQFAKEWVEQLPLATDQVHAARQLVQSPWLQMRSQMLKKLNRNPFTGIASD